jgi:hypothetical protein
MSQKKWEKNLFPRNPFLSKRFSRKRTKNKKISSDDPPVGSIIIRFSILFHLHDCILQAYNPTEPFLVKNFFKFLRGSMSPFLWDPKERDPFFILSRSKLMILIFIFSLKKSLAGFIENNLVRDQQKSWLLHEEKMIFSFGVGKKRTLVHLSTICAIVNGFTGTGEGECVEWPGITIENE